MSLREETNQMLRTRRQRLINGGINTIPSPFKRFSRDFLGLEQATYMIISSFTKGGKCFAKGTEVRMADNSVKKVEDIKPHDFVMSPGVEEPKEVIQIGSGKEKLYRITSQMYNPITVNASHIMYLYDCYKKKYITITMRELFQIYNSMNWEYFCRKYKMVASEAVTIEGSISELPIEPYFYGLWLGDGDTNDTYITTPNNEIVAYLQEYASRLNLHLTSYAGDNKCPKYRICRKEYSEINFKELLGSVSNWSKKHINSDYLNSTIENRYSLLAGLLDTDGYLNPSKSGYEICLQYETLIDDIIDLSRSLGLTCHKFTRYNKKYDKLYYCTTISGNNCSHIPTRLKKVTHVSKVNRRHYCFKIEEVGEGEYYGFTVEGNHLFLLKDYTIVHNTQLVSHLIFSALLYCYYNEKNTGVSIKVLYFPLEETKQRIMTRFYSWLLNQHYKVRISPSDLRSSDNERPVPEDILEKIDSDEFVDIVDYFEDHIIFSEESNPTGIYKECKRYAEEHGKVIKKKVSIKDELGNVKEVEAFDKYVPNNPDEYVFVLIDTINLLQTERGYSKKQTIDKCSEYCITLRDRYGYSPIVIQQQNTDNESIESVKLDRVRPTTAGLGDSKYTSHDANIVLGVFSPFRFGLREYLGYPIDRLKDHFRTLEVLVNRDGELGGIIGLFFDGATCNWAEMPKPNDTAGMSKMYTYLNKIKQSN